MRAETATMQLRCLINLTKRVASVFRRILWCRHSHMSRRYTINDKPYRTCLECGVRRA